MYRMIALGCVGVCLIGSLAAMVDADPVRGGGTSVSAQRVSPETASQAETRKSSRSKLDIAKGDTPPVAGGVKRLTVDDMGTMIENLGYDVKPGTYNDGSKFLSVSIPRGTWTFAFTFDLSGDQSNFWLAAYLGDVKDPSTVRADRLMKLLEAENDVWPGYFVYHTDAKNVYYYRAIVNADIKPPMLRSTLDNTMDSLQSTGDLWDTDQWAKPIPATAPAAPAAPTP